MGDRGEKVEILQFFLNVLAEFYNTIPGVASDGVFGSATENAVRQAQRQFGLPDTGVVDEATWNAIYDAYKGIVDVEFSPGDIAIRTASYPGEVLTTGSRGDEVRTLQQYLNAVSVVYPEIPPVDPTGVYGPRTAASVTAFQRFFGLPETGEADRDTWRKLAEVYYDILSSSASAPRQFPGQTLREGDRDPNTERS